MKTIKYLLVLLILALATPTTQAKTYKEYTLDELIQAADNGDGFAQYLLGYIYSYDVDMQQKYGVQKDYAKAKKYFYMCVTNSDASLKGKVYSAGALSDIYYSEEDNNEEALWWAYYALQNMENLSFSGYDEFVDILCLRIVVTSFIEMYARYSERFISECLFLWDKGAINKAELLLGFGFAIPAKATGIQPAKSLSFGLLRNEDGTYKYIGEKSNGKPNGFGLLFLKNTVYCGEFKDGKYHGKGWLEYKDTKSMIDGDWRDDKIYNGYYYKDGNLDEPLYIYENGEHRIYANFKRLDVGKEDKKGYKIPKPEELSLSVRWASELMGDGKQIYHWGSTNPDHKFQSKSPSAPNYLPRATCLAIYGGAGCNSDITGSGYDAAKCLWANGWRMPSLKEMQELINSCDIVSIYSESNRVMVKRSSKSGLMGELSFVIPRSPDGYGIWTGSIDPNDNERAYALIVDMENESVRIESRDRECQFAILPVTDIPYFKKPLYRIK